MNSQTRNDELLPFQSILIYGMGMMGASLAMALRATPAFRGHIAGVVRSERSGSFIREHHLADEIFVEGELEGVSRIDLNRFDLVVLGLPVNSIVKMFSIFPSYNGLLTDMSSTRREVQAAALSRPDLRFIGSHPMCGSEDAGPSAAKQDLFHDRLCIILNEGGEVEGRGKSYEEDLGNVERLWRSVGMKIFTMDANIHDEVLAYLSHGPHFLSGLLTLWAESSVAVDESCRHSPIPITGGGFRDMARIAGSNPEMWADILETNRDHIIQSLRAFGTQLEDLIGRMEKEPRDWWIRWLKDSRRARNRLCGYREDR